jgi:hypothetical protein
MLFSLYGIERMSEVHVQWMENFIHYYEIAVMGEKCVIISI